MAEDKEKKGWPPGSGLGLGIAIGVALGAAMDHLAVGIAIGVAIGAGLDAANARRGEVDTTNPAVRRRLNILIIGLAILILLALIAAVLWVKLGNG